MITDQARLDQFARETTNAMLISAGRSGVVVRELHDSAEMTSAAGLLASVWMLDKGRSHVDPSLMTAMAHTGNYVAGAYIGNELVGACIGFFSEPVGRALHSHIAGVSSGFASHGIGTALKLHQKAWCLRRGIVEITWTFDPLVARNAYFNVHRLAARPSEYLVNFYGVMQDAYNNDMPSDRMMVRWDLAALPVAKAHTPTQVNVYELGLNGPPPSLDDIGYDTRWHVFIPTDIDRLKETHLAVAQRWRESLRRNLVSLLERDWQITDFAKDGYYILERNPHADHRS